MELPRRKTSIPYSARLALFNSARNCADSDAEDMTRASEFYAYCITIGKLTLSGSQTGERLGNVDRRRNQLERTRYGSSQWIDRCEGRSTSWWSSSCGPSSSNIASDMQVAHYSMALKEYGDKVGRESRYDFEPCSTHPSLFTAHVHVNGSQYEGMARTKKQAQYLASRAACQAIGIAV